MNSMRFVLSIVGVVLIWTTPLQAKTIYDQAGLFSDDEVAQLTIYHAKLLEEHDIDYRIVTIKGTEKSSDLGILSNKAFKKTKTGSSSTSGKGLLLVIAPNSDQVRLEVSRTLEHIYTDSFVAYLQTRQMVPFFTDGHVANGILATTELIFTRAQEAKQNRDFMPPSKAASSGAGAQTDAKIGAGKENAPAYQSKETAMPKKEAQKEPLTPTQVVALYHQAMKNRDARPDLPIYSAKAREMMKNWTMTPAQMDNLSKTMASCQQDKELILLKLAVVRYNVAQRQCSPYFLIFEEGAWRIHLFVINELIRFNHNNEWHLKPKTINPFGFGFGDWVFDKNRYPHPTKTAKLRWQMATNEMYDGNTYVTWVGENSAAQKMGFQYGDRIVSWMGETRINYANIFPLMGLSKPGEKIWAMIKRDGKEMRLNSVAPPYKR